MQNKKFDVAILGSGPGGYPAAIRLGQAGKKVALIEATEVGGTCLNRGCIPTKSLLASAQTLHTLQHAGQFGIHAKDVSFDWSSMMSRKEDVVKKLKVSLEGLIQSNGVEIIRGWGSFASPSQLIVQSDKGESVKIDAQHIIIATGSEPKNIPQFPFDGQYIHSSTSILKLEKLPKSIAIIGGGVIGCEFASLFNDLGVSVTIIEALDRILPLECETVSSFVTKSLQKRGIAIHAKALVKSLQKNADGTGVILDIGDGKTIKADCALVAAGRSLNSEKIGLEKVGIKVEKGAIVVNDRMQTSIPTVWAIGDVTAKAMYAHVATHQGMVAAENILGHHAIMRYDAVPGVIFTRPEVGTVGLSLQKAKEQGIKATLASYPLQGLGKAQAEMHTEGFAQLVIEESTGRIYGAQIVGHNAGNLVAQMALAIANELTIECITETIHAHPTLAEVWMESAFIASGIPLHFPKQMLHTVRKTS